MSPVRKIDNSSAGSDFVKIFIRIKNAQNYISHRNNTFFVNSPILFYICYSKGRRGEGEFNSQIPSMSK